MILRVGKSVVVLALACAMSACGHLPGLKQQARQDALREVLERTLKGRPPAFVERDREGGRLWALTKQFYERRRFEAAWIDGRTPKPQMDELVSAIGKADRDGLDPALYNASTLAARRADAGKGFLTKKGFNPEEAGVLDAWLTYLYMEYSTDLANGLSDLAHADPAWQIRGQKFDPRASLDEALTHNTVAKSLDDLAPRDPSYVALRDALGRYRQIARDGGWPTLPASLKLKPGQRSRAVPLLARRLAVEGDYTGRVDGGNSTYSATLQEAVKRFQRRHGLDPDGVVGRSLIDEMNVPADARVSQLALNLERWRWLPRDLGDRHIFVNIPEYRLEVWDHGRVPLAMRVVVGKKDTPTPIFADEMTYVVFAPYWNVPPDIVEKETLPSVMSDPAFLQRANMEVVDTKGTPVDPTTIDLSNPKAYRFRQRPGTSNSLGLVKFMFPNQYSVYLHDTPADSLFARATRSFSHGCVRLAEPEKLAEYVLHDKPDWTREHIEAAMHAGEESSVKLREPLPVYLAYFTARVSPDGIVQFRNDVYEIDHRQSGMLAATLKRMKARAAASDDASAAAVNTATKGAP